MNNNYMSDKEILIDVLTSIKSMANLYHNFTNFIFIFN